MFNYMSIPKQHVNELILLANLIIDNDSTKSLQHKGKWFATIQIMLKVIMLKLCLIAVASGRVCVRSLVF